MSVAEQAIADSRRILEAGLLDIFFPDAGGNVLAASNADFYNAFLNLVGGGEAYRNRDGSVRQNLSPRIRAAVLAAMLNPERRETVERLLDNPEGYNALINGLMQSAANLAELANKPEYDLSGELSQAVELFVETRDKGQTVDEFAAQTDMFREAPSAETMFLMRLFEENAKSSGGISGVLRQYAAECKKIDTTTQSLFGDENPTKLEKLEEAYRHYAADLSNEAGNGNLRWRDTGEPAAEEISEAQKQYEEVKSKYMGTPLWMKAPNGKPTNLTERQWIQVRTPNFKRWFGDWEKEAWAKAAMDFLEKTAPVRELSGGEFQKDGVKLTEKVPAYFKSIGNVAHNDELGDVVLDLKGVEDSIAHGIGRLKSAAFMAVPDVIEKGFIFNREENWKERGWNTAVIVAPIKLGEDDYVCEVVVKKVRGQQRFYLHEVEIKKTLDGVFKSVANNGNASQVSKLILGKHLAEVKGNVSKVVDENGEPKVVYHGSPYYGFTIFKNESYFTAQKNYAARYKKGGNNSGIYDVFLDIKNPFDTRSKRERDIFEKEFYRKWGNGAPLTERGLPDWTDGSDLLEFIEEKGYNYDGIILDEGADGGYGETVSFRGESYVPLNSTQIKSATDNIGTYSENPDIRWREVSEPIKQKFSSGNTSLRQIAAGFKKIDFKPGTTNFDLGGGKFDEGTKYLETKGVKNFVFDPVNRDSKTNKEAFEIVKNGGFDTTTCNNVLNVISEANVRDNIILQAAKSLRPNGTAYFTVYEGDGSGKGRQSQKDSWQEHRKTVDYLGEIKKHFGDVSLKNKVITARKPILLNEKASWFMDDSFENPVRWKDDADISDISAKVKKIIDSISDKKNKHIEVLRKISDTEADFLLKKTGLDLKGYSHSIDNYSILHILKKHGSEKELQRGQIPVTIKDIQNFPTIVSDYDDVKYAGKSKIGRDTIRFEKNIGDNLVLVFEEMRIGKKLLALSTMYIQKRKKLTSNANASSNTSETLSTSSDFQESANTPEDQENNSRLKALLRQERSENPDIRWRIDDDEALERIKSLSSADIEGIMDEAERVVADNLKESKGRSAARVEADREKYIRDNMSKWEEGGDEDFRYYRNPKAYEISESGGEYKVEDDDGNELDFFTELEDAKRYALERRWEDDVYDELDYKEDLYEDNPQNAMRKQFEYALRKIGIEIVNSTGGTFNGSEYIYLELPNGEEKKIRFADHPQVYSADMSVEEDWRAAFKFFVERVQREDWTEENYPDNIRWKIDDPSPERIEKLRADKWAENPKNVEMAAKKYLSRFGEGQIIVDPDEIRKLVPNYDVSDNSAFVAAGDEILEVVWAAALKRTPKDKPVVLLTGNPAAGKGTAQNGGFLDWVDEANLVFDAPQNKFTSVEKRVRETIDAGHRVRIIQVYNDPITSWKNSLKRGIGKDAPKTGKRDGGRFLPMAYFVEAYKNAQGKVEKIESILRQKYQNNLETKYIDNTENNPIVVSPDEAKAWDYSISDSQLKEIERITDENRGRIEESARLRGDKKDPLAIIGRRISQSLAIPIRGSSKGISRRNEQGVDGTEQSLSRQGGERGSSVSRLKSLFRQDRRENPVIWASIVLAKQILLGRAITNARLDRVLPPERFDGTKREYAVTRAREIAERYRSDKEKFGNDLNLGVQRAENDLYWTRDVVEEMYASFRRDGEEYGIARQRLMEWLKEQRRRDLETVKGLSSEELGIDVPAAIEDALEKEPERRKPGENAAEESGEETFEASGEGIDAEIESAREKPAPSSIRDIIGKIRAGVTKAAKARGMDEAARRRAYRNTLAEVLRESAKRLTYGREREAIMKKISDLSAKGYSVIKIKDGERAGQKIDNYTLRAEHIALRIFNRGVRDTKRELSEKFEKIVSRKGKKPSRMERDDKRALAGAVQMRVYNIKRYSEMDAAELEAEYSATVDRLENVEKNFAERIRHYGAFAKAISKEIRKRAAIVQYGLPPFPASDTIQYRPLCGQSKRRKREQKSSNPKMRCITCESDKTLARLISIKLDLSLYASAPDSYCHASLAA